MKSISKLSLSRIIPYVDDILLYKPVGSSTDIHHPQQDSDKLFLGRPRIPDAAPSSLFPRPSLSFSRLHEKIRESGDEASTTHCSNTLYRFTATLICERPFPAVSAFVLNMVEAVSACVMVEPIQMMIITSLGSTPCIPHSYRVIASRTVTAVLFSCQNYRSHPALCYSILYVEHNISASKLPCTCNINLPIFQCHCDFLHTRTRTPRGLTTSYHVLQLAICSLAGQPIGLG